ncbi:hypothetical protein V8F20_008184 [Naviculisporaceae sp. PSN 640]
MMNRNATSKTGNDLPDHLTFTLTCSVNKNLLHDSSCADNAGCVRPKGRLFPRGSSISQMRDPQNALRLPSTTTAQGAKNSEGKQTPSMTSDTAISGYPRPSTYWTRPRPVLPYPSAYPSGYCDTTAVREQGLDFGASQSPERPQRPGTPQKEQVVETVPMLSRNGLSSSIPSIEQPPVLDSFASLLRLRRPAQTDQAPVQRQRNPLGRLIEEMFGAPVRKAEVELATPQPVRPGANPVGSFELHASGSGMASGDGESGEVVGSAEDCDCELYDRPPKWIEKWIDENVDFDENDD